MHSIWTYSEHYDSTRVLRSLTDRSECAFCATPLDQLRDDSSSGGKCGDSVTSDYTVRACPLCGWWSIRKRFSSHFAGTSVNEDQGNAGLLKKFDVGDQTVPLDQIRAYLMGRYDARFEIHPSIFEDVVGSVYSDYGYRTRVTGRSGDGGVDVILDGPSTIAVQVKRKRGQIEAEQIRAFYGALVLKGFTEGIFVSTSSYRSGAREAARKFAAHGVRIELIDAPRFYEALGIAQRQRYATVRDRSAPFDDAPLIDLLGHKRADSGSILPGCHV